MIEITKQDFFNENLEFIEEKIINDVSSRYYKNKSGEYFLLRLNYYVGFLKYFRITYQKQFMENINLKILVKDTTLINGVKEQGERYIFTKMNSRINNL